MILVTLGTSSPPFYRLLKEIEIISVKLEDSIFMQRGHTDYKNDKFHVFDFLPENQFIQIIDRADLVITHGGFGILATLIKMQKSIVAVPRDCAFGEATNPQQELVKYLEQEGALIGVYQIEDLYDAVVRAKLFNPTYAFHPSRIPNLVNSYIHRIRGGLDD